MALITRISRLFTADVHAVLDRIEEPEVVLKQAVREMAEEVARGEQRLRWLATEGQQLNQRIDDASEEIASLDGELDLCFEAGEEDLARSLVKRKLVAEQHLTQAAHQLDAVDRDHEALTAQLQEQRQNLTDTQQKAELFTDKPANGPVTVTDAGVSQDAVDVAFLKEKQRRQS
jgi:phage shock protein A